jgi:hypothetical protein
MNTGNLPKNPCAGLAMQKPTRKDKAFLDMARAWTQAAARTNGEAAPTSMMPPLGDANRDFSQ